MKSKYYIVAIITSLLIVLSTCISLVNYSVSLKTTQEQLKKQALPLSINNIYTEIQKHIIEPYLVSSMMAHDTFLKDWIKKNDENDEKVQEYLDTIKNKYNMYSTFLVSHETKNYYSHSGFIETIKKTTPKDKWYFDFIDSQVKHEINLDFNQKLSNSMMMFINYKIFDNTYHLLGATGIALKISYINDMLKSFRLKHKFKVYFVNQEGKVVLSEQNIIKFDNIKSQDYLKNHVDYILSKEPANIEYKKTTEDFILQTKYIPELDLNLIVEAKLDDFTKDVKKVFYINLSISLVITLIIALIIIFVIKKNNAKLEYLAEYDSLTKILNRRSILEKLEYFMQLQKRNKQPLSVLFVDIDDFKSVNDTYGHETGDLVLVQIAQVLKTSVRTTDFIARFGGEEFVVLLINSSIDDSKKIAEKIRTSLQSDKRLRQLIQKEVTASIGLTSQTQEDSINTIVARADEAMYKAKHTGKNKIVEL